MAKIDQTMKIEVSQYLIVFFPVACLTVCGDVKKLSVLGSTVYERAGDARRFLWLKWGSNAS